MSQEHLIHISFLILMVCLGTMPYRALRACFGSAYIYFLLVDVYGLNTNDSDSFLPVVAESGVEISWALGATIAQIMGLEITEY